MEQPVVHKSVLFRPKLETVCELMGASNGL